MRFAPRSSWPNAVVPETSVATRAEDQRRLAVPALAALAQGLRDQVAGRARREVVEHVAHDARERVLVEGGRQAHERDQRGDDGERELEARAPARG